MTEIKPLGALELLAGEMFERWDSDQRAGKLLSALAGAMSPGYRAEVDQVRDALRAYPSLLNGLREAREALMPFGKADFSGSIWRDTDPASPGSRVIVGDFRRAAATLAHLDTLLAQEGEG